MGKIYQCECEIVSRDGKGMAQLNFLVNGQPLNPRRDLVNHSLTGMEFGYGGSGPAQLALAILADYTGDDELAVALHQDFKWAFIAPLERPSPFEPGTLWVIHGSEIREWLDKAKQETATAS